MNKVVDENETESYMKISAAAVHPQQLPHDNGTLINRIQPQPGSASETETEKEDNPPSKSARTIIVSRNNLIFKDKDC